MKKIIVSALFLLFGVSSTQCGKLSQGGTFLHDLGEKCITGVRPKCIIRTLLDDRCIDPFLKDDQNRTAREFAMENVKKQPNVWNCCEHLAWELEQYEKRYPEVLKQKTEKK